MSEQKEKVFANGFMFKRNDNAPDFIVGGMSVKVDEAIEFLKSNDKKGWVNLDIKKSKGGKYYVELDTWQPSAPMSEEAKGDVFASSNNESPF